VAPAAAVDEDDDEEEDDDDEEKDIGEVVDPPVVLPPLTPPDAPPVATQLALVNKLREGAYKARRKREEAATLALKRMLVKTWVTMSTQSQPKVREYPGFERSSLNLDSIALWNFIRKSHLTHIYGEADEMSAVNIHDQSLRYHNLRQGDKEFFSDFKVRFDNQVKSNQGVGMPEISEKLRAMDFSWTTKGTTV
jgi:hypothetical protein